MPCYNCCCTYKVTTNSNCNSNVPQVIYLQHLEQSVSAKYHCERTVLFCVFVFVFVFVFPVWFSVGLRFFFFFFLIHQIPRRDKMIINHLPRKICLKNALPQSLLRDLNESGWTDCFQSTNLTTVSYM